MEWRLLQAGLPASASWPATMNGKLWMIPMQAGGVYVSRDAGKGWERWGENETGLVRSLKTFGEGIVWARTQTDGLYGGKLGD